MIYVQGKISGVQMNSRYGCRIELKDNINDQYATSISVDDFGVIEKAKLLLEATAFEDRPNMVIPVNVWSRTYKDKNGDIKSFPTFTVPEGTVIDFPEY